MGGGLVGEQHRRCEDERTGKCGSLLLADGRLGWEPVGQLGEPEALEQFLDPCSQFAFDARTSGGFRLSPVVE